MGEFRQSGRTRERYHCLLPCQAHLVYSNTKCDTTLLSTTSFKFSVIITRKTLTFSPTENWRRPSGRPHSTWMNTIITQQCSRLHLHVHCRTVKCFYHLLVIYLLSHSPRTCCRPDVLLRRCNGCPYHVIAHHNSQPR